MSVGKIVRWQDDKGFGFVKSDDFDKDIFLHITALPKGSPKPNIGDELVFQVQNTPKGLQVTKARYQNQADNTVGNDVLQAGFHLELERDENIPSQPKRTSANHSSRHQTRQSKSTSGDFKGLLSIVFSVLMLGGIGYYAYNDISHRFSSKPQSALTQNIIDTPNNTASANLNFKCDGRQHCRLLLSREEDEWFSKNCTETKMDGDGDGDVCENDSRW